MSMIKLYKHPDRPDYGPGPWDMEPDKAVWIDPDTGLDCMAVRNDEGSGAWCGYVGVPEGHPFFKMDYADIDDINVHGGLTFSSVCHPSVKGEAYGICHVAAPGHSEVWWLGFDCSHWQDMCPGYKAMFSDGMRKSTYRTWSYVQHEITSLAQQLAVLA